MGDVIQITGKRMMTLSEVNELVPLLLRITKKYEDKIEKLLANQRFYWASHAPKHVVDSADAEVCRLMTEWGTKMTKLGGDVLTTKVVSFDSGFGFWSWIYPEQKISHYYDYNEQIHNRRKFGIIHREGA